MYEFWIFWEEADWIDYEKSTPASGSFTYTSHDMANKTLKKFAST
jgi:hypothetical protein